MFNRIFGCFIDFNSAPGGRREGAWMIRKSLMWEMKKTIPQSGPGRGGKYIVNAAVAGAHMSYILRDKV